jgi:hypothetical protein
MYLKVTLEAIMYHFGLFWKCTLQLGVHIHHFLFRSNLGENLPFLRETGDFFLHI